jgi:hypothetical protein
MSEPLRDICCNLALDRQVLSAMTGPFPSEPSLGFLDTQGSSPCLEELTSGSRAPSSMGLGQSFVLMRNTPCVALPRKWSIVPHNCGIGMRCSASAPDRF